MRRWLLPLVVALTLAGLAGSAPFWWPTVIEAIGAESDTIQGLEAAVQIVILVVSAALGLFAVLRRGRSVPRGGLRRARKKYLAGLISQNEYLPMKGLGVADRVPLKMPLLDLYVALEARRELPPGETWKRDQAPELAGRRLTGDPESAPEGARAGALRETEPLLALLAEPRTRGLIVLGDPGAGKTTFLRMLALKLARGEGGELGLAGRLPALAPLSGYGAALAAGGAPLTDYIAGHLGENAPDLPVGEVLAGALRRGKALILLDGLDEVKEPGLRGAVVEQVRRFFAAHAPVGNKFVITSRVVGYPEARPAPIEGLVECTVTDFADGEIAAFVQRWTAALERQAHGDSRIAQTHAERERKDLLAAIHSNPGVRRLAANPLLLTILAVMKRQDVTLPERRVQLYHRYVETLVSTWNRARGLGRPVTSDLEPVNTVRLLADLALWMHRENPATGLVKRGDLVRHLQRLLATRGEPDPEATSLRFIGDVARESSLLLERGAGEYGFIHLTFEEYLAAVGVYRETEGEVSALVRALSAMVGQPAWREVALLTVGYLGIVQQLEAKAGQVVEELVERQPGPAGEAVVLAGEAVLDAGSAGVPAASRTRVQAALVATLQSGATPPPLRRQAGLALGRLGWVPEDLDAFVKIPAGAFLYGESKERKNIERDFWIARYPVTNQQFARFIADRGYERPELWSDDGWRWRCEEERLQPPWWDEQEWGNPIFPVVGVTWFEADAYCRWLGTRADLLARTAVLPDALPPGSRVRLPTEEEWERAARGTDGWVYPWGAGFDATRATTEKSDSMRRYGIGTTAVCTYPQGASPAGIRDASGNVWEWTSSPWADSDPSLVVRGGSWINVAEWARCSYRFRVIPSLFHVSVGFRCGLFPGSTPDS